MKDIKRQAIEFSEKEAPLKTIREFLGMTQREFGLFLGVAENSVSQWERGRREPQLTFPQMKKLGHKLREKGVDILEVPDSLGKPTS